jgi:hypothetical protein
MCSTNIAASSSGSLCNGTVEPQQRRRRDDHGVDQANIHTRNGFADQDLNRT